MESIVDAPATTRPRLRALRADWVIRTCVVLAVLFAVVGLVANPWVRFRPVDDLRPPVARPAVSAAVPSDATMAALIGADLVRETDGLPDTRLFISSLPLARDLRQHTFDGAWSSTWTSLDARTFVQVEVAGALTATGKPDPLTDCIPSQSEPLPAPTTVGGWVEHDQASGAYCAQGLTGRTNFLVGVRTADPALVARLPGAVRAVVAAVASSAPRVSRLTRTGFALPNSRAEIMTRLFSGVLVVFLVWSLPSLLFDRGFWQRFITIGRRRRPRRSIDVDPIARRRLWISALVAAGQFLAAVWVIWLTAGWGTIGTALATTAAVFAVSLAPRIAYLRSHRGSQAFRGRRRVLTGVGLAFAVGVTVFAALAAFAAIAFSALGQGTDTAEFVQQRIDAAIELAALPILLLATVPLMLLRRIAMRSARTEEFRDPRPPVLLLRSFIDDGRRLRSRSSHRRAIADRLGLRRFERFEEVVAATLSERGPVVAVGQVGERLPPPLGAVRRQFGNDVWQGEVERLMADASCICVTVGRTHAVGWEIERIATFGHLRKAIFVLPPTSRAEHRRRLAVLATLLTVSWTDIDVTADGRWALAVQVPERGRPPIVYSARAQEDIGYDAALELASERIDRADQLVAMPSGPWVQPPAPQIYPPGKAPRHKPFWRSAWGIALTLVLVSSVISGVVGYLLAGVDKNTDVLRLAAGHQVSVVAADDLTGQPYVVLDDTLVAAADFSSGHGDLQWGVTVHGADGLAAHAGHLFVTASARGSVQSVDTVAHKVRWTDTELPGARSPVVVGDSLVVVIPAGHEVVRLDGATGRVQSRVHLTGVPWAAAIAGGQLYVTLIDRARLVRLDPLTLHPGGSVATLPGPGQLVGTGRTMWVYSIHDHCIEAITGGSVQPGRILTRNPVPALASNGRQLVVEGDEIVTRFQPGGVVRTQRLISSTADALAVAPDGDVLVAAAGRLLRIRD